MNTIAAIIAVSVAVLFALVVVGYVVWRLRKPPELPYQPTATLFTPAERSFLSVLDEVVGGELRVFGKVRLADIIETVDGLRERHEKSAWVRIGYKHLDFVLCDPRSLEVRLVIELDDRSHQQRERQERDAFVDGALGAAGVAVLHIPVRRNYDVQEIAGLIWDTLEPYTETPKETGRRRRAIPQRARR